MNQKILIPFEFRVLHFTLKMNFSYMLKRYIYINRISILKFVNEQYFGTIIVNSKVLTLMKNSFFNYLIYFYEFV